MRQASVTYTSMAVPSNFNYPSGYSGSASFRVQHGQLLQKKRNPPATAAVPAAVRQKAPSTINKTKVKKKIIAFCRLEKSKRFMAFYTISFPAGMSDDSCFATLNIILTRMRKLYGQFDYIWTAERQKNNTIHYHLITNKFFNIRIINHFAACSIQKQIYNDKAYHINYSKENYNGVDVQRIYNSRKVGHYISKYVTKNDISCSHCVWNCSRSVSALFTSYRTNVDIEQAQSFFARKMYQKEFVMAGSEVNGIIEIFVFDKDPPRSWLQPLDDLNEAIYNETKYYF